MTPSKNIRFIEPVDVEDLVALIEQAGYGLSFSMPYPHEKGLDTSRGVVFYMCCRPYTWLR